MDLLEHNIILLHWRLDLLLKFLTIFNLPTNHNWALPGCTVHYDWLKIGKVGDPGLPKNLHSSRLIKPCKWPRLDLNKVIEVSEDSPNKINGENRQFVCTSCKTSFSNKSNLRKHENKFCQRGSIKIKEQRIRVPNKDGRFPCKNCNQTFKTKPIVKVHEKKSCKNRGSGVWSPLEPDCSFYPLLTEIYCFYGQRNLIFFGLLVVHKTREAIRNFLPMKPVGNFWAPNRIWTLGRT